MSFRELINIIGFELDEPAMRQAEERTKAMFEGMKDFGEKWSLRISAPIIAAGVLAVNEFSKYNEELAIVRQRIESTGGTAGKTADELDEMSNKLSEGVKYSHDEILAGEEALLRFGSVTGKIYDRATSAAIDFAAANKMDVAQSAKLIGRALESPGEGMRRLGIMGVVFTKEEQKRMQQLVASGRTLEAQKMILDRVERSTKGTAKAVADASTGFYKLRKSTEELQESFGKLLLPYFQKFYDIASKVLDWFNSISPEMKKSIIFWGSIAAAIPLVVGALGSLGLIINTIKEGLIALRLVMLGTAGLTWASIAPWIVWALAIAGVAVALALITEDFMAFRAGKKSLIGELLGDLPVWWDKFLESVTWLSKQLNPIRKMLGIEEVGLTVEEQDKEAGTWKSTEELQKGIQEKQKASMVDNGQAQQVGESLFTSNWNLHPSPASSAAMQKTVSNNVVVNQTLPPGTPEEHKKQVKQFTADIFQEHLDKHLRNAYQNFSTVTP